MHIDIGTSEITYAHCSCQAGINGTCSHIVGLMIALQQWQLMGLTEIPSQLSSTSLPQQWTIPRGTKIQPVDVPHIQFVNPKPERKKRPVSNTLTDCRKIRIQEEDITHLQSIKACPISYLACQPPYHVDTYLGSVPIGSGLSTHAAFFQPEVNTVVSVKCGNLLLPQISKVTLGDNHQSIIENITQDYCEKLERSTVHQANSTLWISGRKNRLTSSKFGDILKRKTVTPKFIQSLLDTKSFLSVATSYGKNNEQEALKAYMQKTGNHVHECGLVVNPQFPFLGASPDGEVCDNGNSGLIEVKCPYTARDMTIIEACKLKDFCLESDGKTNNLKTDHQYYYQVQGQLLITGSDFCDFVVYTKKDLHIQRIEPNVDFMKYMLQKLTDFYLSHIKPALKDASDIENGIGSKEVEQ